MKNLTLFLLVSFVCTGLAAEQPSADSANKRTKRFSIFSVVQFANTACTPSTSTSATPVQGICYTTSQCTAFSGGVAQGSCASGYGVCCVITVSSCGTSVSTNMTYIQNPGFPTAYTTAGTCTYTVATTPSICQVRLDFTKMVMANPDTTGLCAATDKMVITSASGSGPNASPPVTCGTLTGSHMYIETGRASSTGATIAITNIGTSTSPARNWKILVTQVECGTIYKAPTDCLQYFTGPANSITSFNYQGGVAGSAQFLKNQNYLICIRQEEGFCTIQYAQNDVLTPSGFQLTNAVVSKRAACADSQLLIHTTTIGVTTPASETYCGAYLNNLDGQTQAGTVTGNVLPFDIGVFSDANTQLGSLGFNLMYSQLPC